MEKSLRGTKITYDSNMCTNSVADTEVDVAALLEAPAGSAVIAVLERLDPMALSEPDRLVLLEVWDKQTC